MPIANEYIWLAALAWGTLLGVFHFGGLWLTLCRLPTASAPGRLCLLSFVFRVVPVLLGMGVALRVSPITFFITLAAFFMVRRIMSRKMAPISLPHKPHG